MWEWREERGRWQLDDSGSWNWDEPSLLQRVGSAPFGAADPRGAGAGRAAPPVPPPGPWAPPEPWRHGASPAGPPADLVPTDVVPTDAMPAGSDPSEETPIFAAVAEDHERDESTGGQRLKPSRHGVPEPGHPGADDRREYRTAPWIPEPSPGSGPFPVPVARHARTDGRDRPDVSACLDGRHAVRR